jgi:hypothetical protein
MKIALTLIAVAAACTFLSAPATAHAPDVPDTVTLETVAYPAIVVERDGYTVTAPVKIAAPAVPESQETSGRVAYEGVLGPVYPCNHPKADTFCYESPGGGWLGG